MKFIHIADIHIGACPDAGKAYSANREREILDSFQGVLEICEREKVDVLLISGGLFHRQPLLRELNEVDYLFSKLTVTKVVLIVGNSDYLTENSYYQEYEWAFNVYPILTQNLSCIEIEELDLAVYGCSYHKREDTDKKLIQQIPFARRKYHILLGYGGDEHHMPFELEELEHMAYDYIGLGYQHVPEILVENKIAYAGALEPIRLSDFGHHGYMQGEVYEREGTTNKVNITFVKYARREYIKTTVDISGMSSNEELCQYLLEVRRDSGMQNLYQFELIGRCNAKIKVLLDEYDTIGNIVRIIDSSFPDYDMSKLAVINEDNLLGAYIRSFGEVEEGSIEYMALYQGVEAIEKTKKG